MSLLLAPYNNAMRLGQGFNSYTQQICIDDAVVVNPERAENVITNDGTTMRIVAQSSAKLSAWTRQKEIVTDDRAKLVARPDDAVEIANDVNAGGVQNRRHEREAPNARSADSEPEIVDTNEAEGQNAAEAAISQPEATNHGGEENQEKDTLLKEEQQRVAQLQARQREIEEEARKDERERRAEDRQEQREIRKQQREWDMERRKQAYESMNKAAAEYKDAITIAELEKIAKQNEFAERFNGLTENQGKFTFDPTGPRGPSQTVVYSSRFVDKLSDITEDMCISGSLSIKASKIGGSGRGSFVDSDKFKESDMNFYISVKVINQSVNFKDALMYNPLRSVTKDNHKEVYGDSFISGFIEGGEFNALVSMKILNKAKKTDIKAEAKVALTAGPVNIEAQANVGIARSNIETNTETTVQVSWCGGGHIKPMEQQWDIQSLMAAAARFPDLVADCPQRTYAILTKYEALRSFQVLKPPLLSPLQYENAQIYTNALMDAFMSYKSVYKRLTDQIFNVQGKTMQIKSWQAKDLENAAESADGTASRTSTASEASVPEPGSVEDVSRFEASLRGLDLARKAIRQQMMRIVNEVDAIEKDAGVAVDEKRREPFQPPVVFESRLPDVDIPEKLKPKNNPLTGNLIKTKTLTEEELKKEAERQAKLEESPRLYNSENGLSDGEKESFDKIRENDPAIGEHMRVSSPSGYPDGGALFNNLEFVKPEWQALCIKIEVAKGAIASVSVFYDNGVNLKRGKPNANGRVYEIKGFAAGERVTSGSIETGCPTSDQTTERVLSLSLWTNRGRSLTAQAENISPLGNGTFLRDEVQYNFVKTSYFDAPLSNATLKGFFGRSDDSTTDSGGLIRLGLIWGDDLRTVPESVLAAFNEPVKDQVVYGRVDTLHHGEQGEIQKTCKYQHAQSRKPRILSAVDHIDTYSDTGTRFTYGKEVVSKDDLKFTVDAKAKAWNIGISFMSLPDNEVNFNYGIIDTAGWFPESFEKVVMRVKFEKPYQTVPENPYLWFMGIDTDDKQHPERQSIALDAFNLSETGFTVVLQAVWGTKLQGAQIGWLSWDKEYTNKKVWAWYDDWRPPSCPSEDHWKPSGIQPNAGVLTGIRAYEVSSKANTRLTSQLEADQRSVLRTTWADTTVKWVRSICIAVVP